MLRNIKPSWVEHIERYVLSYSYRNDPYSGFSFPCDSQGNRFPNALSDDNHNLCVSEAAKADGSIVFGGVDDWSSDYRHPAEGTCSCGRIVYLVGDYGHGIDCDCGRIYNASGQELRPRSQWEEHYSEDSTVPYYAEFGYTDQ